MVRHLLCGLLACCALAACGKPEPPEKERKPEPQAARATEPDATIRTPIDRAKAVDGQLEEAEDRRREAIEESGG